MDNSIAENEGLVHEGTSAENNGNKGRKRGRIAKWIGIALAGLVCVISLVAGRVTKGLLSEAGLIDISASSRSVDASVDIAALYAASDAYRTDLKNEYEVFKGRVERQARDFEKVRAAISSVVSKYGFGRCFSIAMELGRVQAAEKLGIKVDSKLDELVNGYIREGFYRPLAEARGQMVSLLTEYRNGLEVCRRKYARQLAQIVGPNRSLDEVPDSLAQASLRIEKVQDAIFSAQVGTCVSAAVEASAAYLARQMFVNVLRSAAARLAGAFVAGGTAALVDGPLPIGDCIRAGLVVIGGVSVAIDVRKAATKVPAELSRVLNQTVTEQCKDAKNNVLDEGERLLLAYLKASVPTASQQVCRR